MTTLQNYVTDPVMDQKLFSALLRATRAVTWECDPGTLLFLHVDLQAESILGYPTRHWLEEPDFWRRHSHPDDIERCFALFRDATKTGEDREMEHRMTAADGATVWFHTVVTPALGKDGVIRLRGAMMDISESARTKKQLESSEERFKLAMLGANDGIWDWDLLTDEVYYSPRWKEMLGYNEHELGSHLNTWSSLTHPEDRSTVLGLVRDYVAGRNDTFETEFRMKHRDGHYINVLSRAILSRDAGGKAVRLIGTHVDITGVKRAEEELYFAQYCLDQAPLGILRFDLELNVLYANRHACESLGYSQNELCQMSVFDFNPHFRREDLPAHLEKIRQMGEMTFEVVHRNRDGVTFPMEIIATRLEYQEKEFLFSFEKNITERKRTERALREQEELYSAMFNQAPDGIVLVDVASMRAREFNDMACQVLGYSREEFSRLGAKDIYANYDHGQLAAHMEEIDERGHAVFENTHRHRDGSLRHVRVSACTVTIHDQRYVLAFWTDITEQTRLQEEIRMREYYQRALLDNFPFPAWIKDRDGRFLAVNRQLVNFLGLPSHKDLVGKTIHEVAPENIAGRKTECDRKVLLSCWPERNEEELPVRGEKRWFDVHLSPVTINGSSIGTVGCTWDITERKAMEQALRESEERYRMLVELSPDVVFINSGGKFVFVNPAAVKLLGAQAPEELYGTTLLNFIPPSQRETFDQRIRNAMNQHNTLPIEELMVRLDGSTVPVEMVTVQYTWQGADAVLSIVRDISERKRIEDERFKTQKLESLGLLAGGIAHDFNNILTGILGNISLVRAKLDPAEPLANRLESCEKAAIQATGLTRQLLTFARGGEPVRKVINPAPLIRESASFVLRGSNVKSDIRIAENLRCINADAGQISQVLHNLIINAAHSMPGGGIITISATNEILESTTPLALPVGNYLNISVRDHGCGIPEENLTRIFDPYFTTKSKGSGLGLASAYSIIKRHGGSIEVSSSAGKGTVFTLRLPALPQGGVEATNGEKNDGLAGSGKILVMDDEELIRDVAREILGFAGYSVKCCADGREAVELF